MNGLTLGSVCSAGLSYHTSLSKPIHQSGPASSQQTAVTPINLPLERGPACHELGTEYCQKVVPSVQAGLVDTSRDYKRPTGKKKMHATPTHLTSYCQPTGAGFQKITVHSLELLLSCIVVSPSTRSKLAESSFLSVIFELVPVPLMHYTQSQDIWKLQAVLKLTL